MKQIKILTISAISIIILALVVGGVYFYLNKKNQPVANQSNKLEEIVPIAEKNDKQKQDGSVASPAIQATSGQLSVDGVNKDSSNYYFNTSLSGINKGSCLLTLDQSGKITKINGEVELVTSYYSCSGMHLPISSLSKGKVSTTLVVTDGSKVYKSNTKELSLE